MTWSHPMNTTTSKPEKLLFEKSKTPPKWFFLKADLHGKKALSGFNPLSAFLKT
jgi:hypothetical protein